MFEFAASFSFDRKTAFRGAVLPGPDSYLYLS